MSATPSRLSNYVIPVPGSDVTACLGIRRERDPEHWIYTLWTDYNDDSQEMIAQGSFDIPQPDTYTIAPEQVANVAFLLEVDWKGGADDTCQCSTRCPEDATYCCSCGFRIQR